MSLHIACRQSNRGASWCAVPAARKCAAAMSGNALGHGGAGGQRGRGGDAPATTSSAAAYGVSARVDSANVALRMTTRPFQELREEARGAEQRGDLQRAYGALYG